MDIVKAKEIKKDIETSNKMTIERKKISMKKGNLRNVNLNI